ncbi:MAG: OmpH family outer membrane protein [Flavobacteriaceae bacterium]|nr:OmpH family outer membrane protein [Flavobacteriaceae bacterium]
MKYISTLVLTLALILSSATFAQSKVAHIDFQKLISEMPSVLAAQEEVQKLEKDYQTEIEASIKEYQTKLQTYSAEAETQTDVTNQARQQELAGMEQNIQQFRQTASQDIQKKQADLLRPIIENARAKIQEIAKGQGFDYVLDASLGGSVMMAEGKDLEPDVKKALGI